MILQEAAMDRWSRRDFLRISLGLTGLGLLAGCGASSAPGQGTARTPRIGFLAPGPREDFLRGLREHGYEDGRNIHIEYRFSEGRSDRLSGLATELVDLQPDVLVTIGPRRASPPSRPPAPSRSLPPRSPTRSGAAWSPASRGRAGTSPG